MAITTSMLGSFKAELAFGAHRFGATVTPTGNLTNTSNAVASLSAATGINSGMAVSGTGVPASTVIAAVGASTLTLSNNATATNTGVTLTIQGDTFKCALIKSGMAGTYNASSTNYSNITGNSDEVSGTGYTATGVALTNVSPQNSAGNAYWSFGANPSWTSATFSAAGCMIYNTAANLAGVTGRGVSVHDFGGTQSVTAGTFTVLLPANAANTSVLQIN